MHSERVKILGIAPYTFLPALSGGQRGIHFFYKYLGVLEHTIVASTKNNDGQFADNYKLLKVFSSKKSRYANPLYLFTLRKLIINEKITHLILEHPYMGWLGILLKKLTKIKLIVRSHNIEGLRFKSTNNWWWQLLLRYEKFVHQQSDINFFISVEDKLYAQTHFNLRQEKCFTITYGTEKSSASPPYVKAKARQAINSLHQISADEVILFFNGAFNYLPNLNALKAIINHINPKLEQINRFKYKIIICGIDIPEEYTHSPSWAKKNILFLGFVPDISLYFLAADIFINPVIEGGGIKTKLVEALAYGNSAVSTKSGAIGIPPDCAKNKMAIVEDNNWDQFATAIVQMDTNLPTNEAFFEHFYWGNIAQHAVNAINTSI